MKKNFANTNDLYRIIEFILEENEKGNYPKKTHISNFLCIRNEKVANAMNFLILTDIINEGRKGYFVKSKMTKLSKKILERLGGLNE